MLEFCDSVCVGLAHSPVSTELHSDCTVAHLPWYRRRERIVVARVRRVGSGPRRWFQLVSASFFPCKQRQQNARRRARTSAAWLVRPPPPEPPRAPSHVPRPAPHNVTSQHHRPVPEAHCWGHPSVPLYSSAGASPAPPLDLNCQREPSVAARTDLNCVHTAPEAGRWHEQSPDGFAAALQ